MRIQPVKGTNDYLPDQARLRDYLQREISAVYERSGFSRITTPVIEDIENLDKSDGGDNLNLIFKILKRGDKLDQAVASGQPDQLADMGLRYDLTLPLCRYYAHNQANLPNPFKVIQMDRVYRAERPQKGRLREFMQCDIDILGSESPTCEIELIHTTAKALLAIGIDKFRVKVNDRRVLREVLVSIGFEEKDLDSVCITFDKLDKIKKEGVKKELTDKEFDASIIDSFMDFLDHAPFSLDYIRGIVKNTDYIDSLAHIIQVSNSLSLDKYQVVFDMTLVRGQGYYTGTVFEVESMEFKSSIAGGGRYDNLIGKFVKNPVPAVGFSIGFERIYSILQERNALISGRSKRVVLLYDEEKIGEAISKAESLRDDYEVALFLRPKKMGKFLNRLEQQGYDGFMVLGQDEEIRFFGQ